MIKSISKLISITAIILLTAQIGIAQQKTEQRSDPQYVDFSGFKGRIFEIKHRDPDDLISILRVLTSGFKGAVISGNRELRTITVRDFPENIATIEEAIKRLDVPPPPKATRPVPKDIDITIHVLLASGRESDGNQYPQMLKDVVTQIQNTLNYKSFQLLTSIVQRSNLRNGGVNSRGKASVPGTDASVDYRLEMSNIGTTPEDDNVIGIKRFVFAVSGANDQASVGFGAADIVTSLNVRPGEKVVVGTATINDKAIILVLTVKV